MHGDVYHSFIYNFYLFTYWLTCGTWKFLDQGLNLHHSSDLKSYSDNTRSLTFCTTRELLFIIFKEKEATLVSMDNKIMVRKMIGMENAYKRMVREKKQEKSLK